MIKLGSFKIYFLLCIMPKDSHKACRDLEGHDLTCCVFLKTTVFNQHMELEGKLEDLRAWVDRTSLTLNSGGCDSETDGDSLRHSLQQWEVNPVLSS